MSSYNSFFSKGVLNTLENYKQKKHLKSLNNVHRKINKIVNYFQKDTNNQDNFNSFNEMLREFRGNSSEKF